VTRAPLRIGLVGCGRLAERAYLPALAALPELRLVAVADPDPERRTHLAAAIGDPAPATAASARELVARHDGLDGVLIASPVSSHVADAAVAASAGLRVLLEKPPAATADEAAALLRLDPSPWIAFNRRFDVDARRVAAAVPVEGPIELDLRLHYRRPSWAPHTVRDDALLDLGPHLADWAVWLSRRPVVGVACQELTADRARVRIELAEGQVTIDAATNRPHDERIVLGDARGRTIVAHRTGGLRAAMWSRLVRRRAPDRLVATVRAELAAFAAALRDPGRDHGLGTVADGVRAMAVVDAARASGLAGGVAVALAHEVSS
jgi:predicted dehydrogenase